VQENAGFMSFIGLKVVKTELSAESSIGKDGLLFIVREMPSRIIQSSCIILQSFIKEELYNDSIKKVQKWEQIMQNANLEQEVIHLSKEKWRWMSERNVATLDALFHEKSVFVHMGGAWGKERELEIIRSSGIHYKQADIHEVSVNIIDQTAILLNRITLLAVVGGNEVINPFMVTEVYVQQDGSWKLGSLSFTRLITPNDTH
jgi:hypothetical protein